jgi:hypothetical protein
MKALETGFSLHRGLVGRQWTGRCFTADFERKGRFCCIRKKETLFIEESERYVKEGSRNRELSP